MHLVVDKYGAFLGKKSERLVVREQGKVVTEVPLFDLKQVTVASAGVSLSTDVIRECTERGIEIIFLSSSGRPYARLSSPDLTATVITRREQILAYLDQRGVDFAKAVVRGKVKNQAGVLKYFSRHRKTADPVTYTTLQDAAAAIASIEPEIDRVQAACIDEARGTLLSIEGRSAQEYWTALAQILSGRVDFPGREHRGAQDPFNACLNYGYGILYSQVWGAVTLAGLEPFAGFLHVDRPGRPSLVLDLVEEHRQAVVDRPVVALFTKGFKSELEDGRLNADARKKIAQAVLERLEDREGYEGKKHLFRSIIQLQAQHLAMFLRRERKYQPFVASW